MVGQTISQYRIEEEIGRGGMGVVYRAHDLRLRRDVAVKLLTAETSGEDRRARLLAEARAASSLNHPVITTIYEVREEDGFIFIVMELLRGKTLRELASTRNEPKTVTRLGAQIAEGLAAAHEQGLIHGDIKPENVILLEDGRLKLLDFGLARQTFVAPSAIDSTVATASARTTSSGGTLAYMAPEQLLGASANVQTDLFALGVMLYELLQGQRPEITLLQTSSGESRPDKAEMPARMSAVLDKLLQREPVRRYQSAREVQSDLANLSHELDLGLHLPATIADMKSVAVLPLKLLTPNPDDQYLCIALADALINRLSGSEFMVRPTSAVQRYRNENTDPFRAGRELNVHTVVEGSIQRFGQKLRVHVQVWNVSDGTSKGSAKYDSDIFELFALQDNIGDGLWKLLGAAKETAAREMEAPRRVNNAAYELFLRAVEKLSRLNRWDVRTAIEMLESATKTDPKFADAWARLGEAYLLMAVAFDAKPFWSQKATRAIARAVALDPKNADAYSARGRLLWSPAKGFKHSLALRAFDKALALNPGCHQAQVWRGVVLNHIGLFTSAKSEFTAALATNPGDAYTMNQIGQMFFFLGEFEEADDYFSRALALDPSHLWASMFSVAPAMYMGDLDRAEAKIKSARHAAGDDQGVLAWESLLWAKRGERRKARVAAEKALKDKRYLTYTHHAYHQLATSYATLGDVEDACKLIKKASRSGLPNYPLYRDDLHFRPVHEKQQFGKLMSELKKQWETYRREVEGKAGLTSRSAKKQAAGD